MAEKTLNTRIGLKYDSLANWTNTANQFTLKAGEVAFATIAAEAGSGLTEPVIMAKIGNGSDNFNALPWSFYAKASDVYPWAKAKDVVLDGQVIKFKRADGTVEHSIDLSSFITADELTATLAGYKTKQTAVAAQANDGTKTVKISQNENGEITVEQVDIAFPQVPSISITDDTEAEVPTAATVDVYKNVTANGHTLTEELVQVATAKGVADALDSANDYTDTEVKKVQDAVDAIEEDLGNVDGLSTTNKTVTGAINEVLAAVGTGGTAAVVTLEKSTDGLTYTLKQGTATVGTIDIPKDMVVKSGSVVTNPTGQPAGTYIELVLANATQDKIYVNVGTLIDIYTAKANAPQVQLAIDSATREISAIIVAGSITATELAVDAVTTVKIADGNVTKTKLSTAVQASLDKADSAIQEADLGTMAKETAADYVKKSEATGYGDILTKTQAASDYYNKSFVDTYVLGTLRQEISSAAGTVDAKVDLLTNRVEADEKNLANNYYDKTWINEFASNTVEAGLQGIRQTLTTDYLTTAQNDAKYVQQIKTTANGGLKVTGKDQIDIDTSVTFVFDCGSATKNVG